MADTSLLSPTNKHFFQPLLPSFHSHLNIPIKFFSEHIEGKHEGKIVKLRSDAFERTWKVNMDGHRLTNGWREFVNAHSLRVDDIVVFRHEGDLLFHVTALGSNLCEIQYSLSGRRNEDEEESDESDKSLRSEKKVEENKSTESKQSSFDLNCFRQYVTASNLSRDCVGVPTAFAKQNGLSKESEDIVLMNEEGKSWPSELKILSFCRVVIIRGWTSFCTENTLGVGDSCTFRLLRNTGKTVFRLCSCTKTKKSQSGEEYSAEETRENRFMKLTPTSNSLKLGKQHLPASFTRENILIKPGKIILVDKDNVEWSMELKVENRSGLMYIMSGNGWRSFCETNRVQEGESLTLELIRVGTTPFLRFCSKMEQSPFEAQEVRTHKRARDEKWSQDTTVAEGEPSHRIRTSIKTSANQGNLQDTQPCSVTDQMANVKQSVVDTLASIRRFRAELETMEQKLECSLPDIDNLGRISK